MKIEYWAGPDMLNIRLVERPSVESEEVVEGFVFDYDDQSRIVNIEIDNASQRVDLSDIKKQAIIIRDSVEPVEIFSLRDVAKKLDVGVRAIQKTLQQMATAGQAVGTSNGQTASIILTAAEVDQIREWRATRRPGRPKAKDGKVAIAAPIGVKSGARG